MYEREEEVVEEILEGMGFENEGESEAVESEVDLAAELLEVSTDAELDQFFDKIVGAAGKFLRSPAGNALKGVLKKVAKKALPIAGAALGNMFVPGAGAVIGGKLASGLGSALGLEVSGLPQEEVDLEVAKRLVRMATQATRQLVNDPRVGADPTAAVRDAVAKSLRRNLPGLVSDAFGTLGSGASQTMIRVQGGQASGRWVRKGNRIVLYGV